MRTRSFKTGFLLFVLTFALQVSASSHVSGELGLWLHNKAGPAISDLVNKHPRFLGESIRIVALSDGRPVEINNELASRLRDHLQQELLENSSVRIPLNHSDSCYVQDVNIVLGVEIKEHSRYEHRIMLAFLDVDENVWINRSAQLWVGRLTTHQKSLLSKPVRVMQTAFYARDTQRIAESFATQLKCTPPLETPVYVATDNEVLKEELSTTFSRSMTLTNNRQEAETVLAVTNPSQNQLRLELQNGDRGVPLAEVQLKAIAQPATLLSDISLEKRKRECRGHGKHCVDINYEVFDDAYVFEFYTRKGKMAPLGCDLPSPSSGVTHYGLKVKPGGTLSRPALGYYVLATRDVSAAYEVADVLASGSSKCGDNPTSSWTERLGTIIHRYQIDWRAIHLTNTRGKIRAL